MIHRNSNTLAESSAECHVSIRKTRVGERLVRSFSHQTRDRKELATKQFVLPELEISESTKVFLGSF